MLFFETILAGAAMLGVAAAVPTQLAERQSAYPNTGVSNNYYYMGCYPYQFNGDSTIITTKYSLGESQAGGVQGIQDCASVCNTYYAFIVGGGNYCYCLTDRATYFPPSHESLHGACRTPCKANPSQMCGGGYGSGMFSLFEQA